MALSFNPAAATCSGPAHNQLHVLTSGGVPQEVLSLFLGNFHGVMSRIARENFLI